MKNFALGLLFSTLVIASGCHVTVDPYQPPVDKVQSFVNLLNSNYWGSDFYVVKSDTLTEGFVVVYSPDYGYMAYDIAGYYPGMSWYQYSTSSEYQEVYINRVDQDPWSGEMYFYGHTFFNDYYGSYAGEYIFEETAEEGKDLEKIASFKEAYKVAKIGEKLAAQYGLSEERGVKIAKLAVEWNKLGKKRELTTADANAFSKELIGVSIADAETAVKSKLSGDSKSYDKLIEKAAAANETSPEHISQIMSDIIFQ